MRINWKKMKLTKEEQQIEDEAHLYRPVSKAEFQKTVAMLKRFREKSAILHIRMNPEDLNALKRKALKAKLPYQTYIAELLHQYAVR